MGQSDIPVYPHCWCLICVLCVLCVCGVVSLVCISSASLPSTCRVCKTMTKQPPTTCILRQARHFHFVEFCIITVFISCTHQLVKHVNDRRNLVKQQENPPLTPKRPSVCVWSVCMCVHVCPARRPKLHNLAKQIGETFRRTCTMSERGLKKTGSIDIVNGALLPGGLSGDRERREERGERRNGSRT